MPAAVMGSLRVAGRLAAATECAALCRLWHLPSPLAHEEHHHGNLALDGPVLGGLHLGLVIHLDGHAAVAQLGAQRRVDQRVLHRGWRQHSWRRMRRLGRSAVWCPSCWPA